MPLFVMQRHNTLCDLGRSTLLIFPTFDIITRTFNIISISCLLQAEHWEFIWCQKSSLEVIHVCFFFLEGCREQKRTKGAGVRKYLYVVSLASLQKLCCSSSQTLITGQIIGNWFDVKRVYFEFPPFFFFTKSSMFALLFLEGGREHKENRESECM